MVLMTASIRSKPPFLIWTFLTFLLTPKLKLQLSSFTRKESTSFLTIRPILTLKVTGMLLKLTKRNLSRMLPIISKGIRLWRRPERPLPFNHSFFFCKLLAFNYLRELYLFLPSTLLVNICLFVGFLFTIFIYPLLMFVHSCVAFCLQFLKYVLLVYLRDN